MSSLRERRRKRTADTIRRAAIELAFEHGLENVTTEMISDKAGISARTFFNYFAYKEMVFAPPVLNFSTEVFEDFIQAKNSLIDDVQMLFLSEIEEIDADRRFVLKLHEISLKNPKIMTLRMSAFHETEQKFADLIAARYKGELDDVNAQHIAAMVMASIRVGFESWMRDDKGTLSDSVTGR
ncbi:MAG: TetR family transcriptional regulator, partial [OCS116 cluster bacterium]|nr:TetR family transcriptional regulator [OCS116 cluster bacterium]